MLQDIYRSRAKTKNFSFIVPSCPKLLASEENTLLEILLLKVTVHGMSIGHHEENSVVDIDWFKGKQLSGSIRSHIFRSSPDHQSAPGMLSWDCPRIQLFTYYGYLMWSYPGSGIFESTRAKQIPIAKSGHLTDFVKQQTVKAPAVIR